MLENNKTYTIWETLHTFSDWGEEDTLIPDIELIESLPPPVKGIIAYYARLIPDYMWRDDAYASFVAALGDFSTLEQAQRKLLKGHRLETAFDEGTPVLLKVKETESAIFFTCYRGWQNAVTDEFRISKDGKITCIPDKTEHTDPISYDRDLIIYRYYDTHTIKLNGNKIDFRHTYLDYSNIESVSINEKGKIVYIEQKNKNPEYFSPSSIDLSQLAIPVKSVDELNLLIMEDGAGKHTRYDNKRTKIELGAIRALANELISTDGKKCMSIVLYF